jgi:hypothetical protein
MCLLFRLFVYFRCYFFEFLLNQNNNLFKFIFSYGIMRNDDDDLGVALDDDFADDEPIPARRDIRIFHRKKEDNNHKDDDFDEDVFV